MGKDFVFFLVGIRKGVIAVEKIRRKKKIVMLSVRDRDRDPPIIHPANLTPSE